MEKVLVIGGAKSGTAVSQLLVRKGYDVTLTDRNVLKDRERLINLGIKVVDGGHPDSLKNENWSFIVKNPGIPYFNPFVKYFVDKKVRIVTEVEIGYEIAKKFRYGAITGTNGKTTITSILYELLKCNDKALLAGNIGYPLCSLVLEHEEEEKDVAIELSNFQLLGMETFRPLVSVICNLAPDHLDYMPTVESYYESKAKIFENQKDDDWFLRNADDEIVMEYAKDVPCTCIDFSMKRCDVDLYVKDGTVYLHDTVLFHTKDLKIVGPHNISNAMVAACMAYKMGVSLKDIQRVISEFEGVEHRLEYIGEKNGVRFYNDSKATNTQAVVTALSSFDKNIILLAGGHDKGIPFDDLTQFDERVKLCVSFGETKEMFKPIFSNVISVETMKDALDEALKHSESGDVIVLSPACSSYDQFDNYEQRGRIFKEYVRSVIE